MNENTIITIINNLLEEKDSMWDWGVFDVSIEEESILIILIAEDEYGLDKLDDFRIEKDHESLTNLDIKDAVNKFIA